MTREAGHRVDRPRPAGRTARVILAALGVALVAAIVAAAAVERPAAAPAGPGLAWSEAPDGAGGLRSVAAPGSATPTPATPPSRYVFPVRGKATYAREHHDYPASDIIARCGLPFRAVTSGVVLEVSRTDRWSARTNKGGERGGLFVSLLGDDGVRYYGSHLRAVAGGVEAGVRVAAGDPIGEVGDTGDASVCHLHFGISPPCAHTGDWWVRRGAIWPWSYLDSWNKGGQRSPAKEIAGWQREHGCPAAP